MAKEKFRQVRFSKANVIMLGQINSILEEYANDGLVLTLRQCYYQLVSRDIIPNTQREYAKLSALLTNGRMGGVVDWDLIEDRVRRPRLPYYADDIKDALKDMTNQYRLDRMTGQKKYIEIWIEKDALSNVVYRVTSEYHIRLMVNRGYSSCSAMHDAYNRFLENAAKHEEAMIIYMGDHDPSGLDMIRDIDERMNEFGSALSVKQIALTMKQIKQFDSPENPAKITDPRAKTYIKEFGKKSWELDALPPKELDSILRKSIESNIDRPQYEKMLALEKKDVGVVNDFMLSFDKPKVDVAKVLRRFKKEHKLKIAPKLMTSLIKQLK